MGTIKQYFQNAELAQAAYGTFSGSVININELTVDKVGMSSAQAEEFVKTWKVVDQYTAPSIILGLTGSGFSATVFQNISTGEYVFAVRGTEPGKLNDWDADLFGIGGPGLALRQAVDLYNYRKSLEVPAGQAYQAVYLQLDVVKTAGLAASALGETGAITYAAYRLELEHAGYWVEGANVYTLEMGTSTDVATSGLETGRLSTALDFSDGYDVTGHSLGGHLSLVLGRLDSNNVENVTTFNPPYFDPNILPPFFSRQNSEHFFEQLSQLEIAAYGSSGISGLFKYSQNFEVENDIVNKIGANRPGVSHTIFSEGDLGNTPISAHSMIPITDMLSAELPGCAPSCPRGKLAGLINEVQY